RGKKLTIVPEDPRQTLSIENLNNELELLDGRAIHNNGWFIVRSLVPAGATTNAIEWLVTPNVVENYLYDPVVQVSQVGYHPEQEKIAVIETDKDDPLISEAKLLRLDPEGTVEIISEKPQLWGDFLRYRYYQLDFSEVSEP